MAKIHITEIQKMLFERGENEAMPDAPGGFFLEIRFDNLGRECSSVDEEMKDMVITADCPYGFVTIQFDSCGELKSIDLS